MKSEYGVYHLLVNVHLPKVTAHRFLVCGAAYFSSSDMLFAEQKVRERTNV